MNKYTRRLFKLKKPYDTESSDELFLEAMKENCRFQYENCEDYRRILDKMEFSPDMLVDYKDMAKLPFIPTLYFKKNKMFSVKEKSLVIKATSSGTSGKKSVIGFNIRSLLNGLNMVISVGRYHKLWSIKPVNYLIFGYEPDKSNQTAISKTAFGFTFFAPALSRTYAIRFVDGEYQVDLENMKKAFIRYSKSNVPVRTIGFPAYTYFLLKQMKEEGISVTLPKGSLITLGGGWKQFYSQAVSKEEFYRLVKEVLGVDEENIVEFFGAVEHPILYTDCKYHHFHVPVYSRVIIRDVDTLKPVSNGEAGLVNLLTPMVDSVPILSIMTDDLGILHEEGCPCNEKAPWIEILGRVGIRDIVTCASGAQEYLKKDDGL